MERDDFAGSDPEPTNFLGPAERGRAGCVAEHARSDVPDHGSDTHSTRVEVLRCWSFDGRANRRKNVRAVAHDHAADQRRTGCIHASRPCTAAQPCAGRAGVMAVH